MGHEYVKEPEVFNTSRNGTVPKPSAQEVSDAKVLCANGSWVAQSGGGGGSSILLAAPIYVRGGRHCNSSGERWTYSNIQESPFPSGAVPFTVEVFYYAYKKNANIDPYLICFGDGAYHQAFGVAIKRIVIYGDDFQPYDDTSYGLHHKVVTYDGNLTLNMYLDGALVNTRVLSTALDLKPVQVTIGCWLDGYNEALYGDIYNIRIYGSEFSAGDVLALYNQRGLG